MTGLPSFTYHPDPLTTGSVKPADTLCRCCGKARGYIYTGPVYAVDDLQDCICPWCIADGAAAQRFAATFTDEDGIGGYGTWDSVAVEIVREIATRTPGFIGWQQEQWWTHCSDGGAFVGAMGRAELKAMGEQAVAAIRQDSGLDGKDWEDLFAALDKNSGPTAYLFRCRHCDATGGYFDCD